MTHNEIAAICREIVAAKLEVVEDDIPVTSWNTIIYNFAASHAGKGESEKKIRSAFSLYLEETVDL